MLSWTPSAWALINSVRTPEALRQQLVVIPAQYRAADAAEGTERLFTEMSYTVYYSGSSDVIPPSIWTVRAAAERGDDAAHLQVDVTDFSGVVQVTAAYTTGDGEWRTTPLARAADDPSRWLGLLPIRSGLTYFVQAVDGAGNVALQDNRGYYFTLRVRQQYLPLIAQGIFSIVWGDGGRRPPTSRGLRDWKSLPQTEKPPQGLGFRRLTPLRTFRRRLPVGGPGSLDSPAASANWRVSGTARQTVPPQRAYRPTICSA